MMNSLLRKTPKLKLQVFKLGGGVSFTPPPLHFASLLAPHYVYFADRKFRTTDTTVRKKGKALNEHDSGLSDQENEDFMSTEWDESSLDLTKGTQKSSMGRSSKEGSDEHLTDEANSEELDENAQKLLAFNDVDSDTSKLNAQNFFMKSHELIPKEELQTLAQRIQVYRTKVLSYSLKSASKSMQRVFLQTCKNLFERHDAMELMEYLRNTRIEDLNTRMMGATVHDIESQSEMQDKLGKFSVFARTKPPSASYLFDTKGELDTHMSRESEARELQMINKVGKMSFQQLTRKKKLENMAAYKIEDQLDDLVVPEGEEAESAEFEKNREEHKIILDEDGSEQNSDLNPDIEGFATHFGGELSSSFFIESTVSMNPDAPSQQIEQAKARSDHTYDIGDMLSQTQGKTELFSLNQRGYEKRETRQTNWIYLYNLPYEIKNPTQLTEYINEAFKKIGSIKNAQIFSFKDYLDVKERDNKIAPLQSLREAFEPQLKPRDDPFGDEEQLGEDEQPEQKEEEEIALARYSDMVLAEAEGVQVLEEAIKDKTKTRLKKTDKILKKMKEKAGKRLDRSYALIELDSYEQKQRALAEDIRIFGILIDDNLCMIDDADYKLSLTCYNIHWGSSLKHFCDTVNNVFEQNNMSDLVMEIPKEHEKKVLTKFFVFLRFNTFHNTIRAMTILDNLEYNKRALRIHHAYGSLRHYGDSFFEVLDYENTLERVVQKRNEQKLRLEYQAESQEASEPQVTIVPAEEEAKALDLNIFSQNFSIKGETLVSDPAQESSSDTEEADNFYGYDEYERGSIDMRNGK